MAEREARVREYARARMAAGELIGWAVTRDGTDPVEVTFAVPDDVDPESFPDEIAGMCVRLHVIHRPIDLSRG
ncbi:hypothetical protein [Kitasatospora sp. NPDC056181]|uniref:hypothetical protein n=1 Tax=Kitasatospora sp. NPDC056181 TaxID=3345737 RepID=UPI0035DE562A